MAGRQLRMLFRTSVAQKADTEGRANFAAAQTKRLILREERTFVTLVDGTFCKESVCAPAADDDRLRS